MAIIANLGINLVSDISGFQKSMGSATGEVVELEKKVTSSGGGISSMLGGTMAGAAKIAAGGFIALSGAVAATVAGLAALAFAQFDHIDNLAKTSDRLGLSVEALSGLQHGFQQAGVEGDTLNDALKDLQKNTSALDKGSQGAIDTFAQLGLTANDLSNMPADEKLGVVADALQGIHDPADKARIAMEVFGESGLKLLNGMANGSAGLEEYRKQAERLGLTLSRDQAAAVEAANDAMDNAKKAIQSVGIQLAPIAAKFVTSITTFITEAIVYFRQLGEQFRPHLEQLYNIWVATWGAIQEVFSIVWEAITAAIAPAVSFISDQLGLTGTTFDDFKSGLLMGLVAIEFGLKNWQQVGTVAITAIRLGFETFKNDASNIFSNTLPAIFDAFGNYSYAFFENLGQNIMNAWDSIVNYFTTGEIGFAFEPLEDGLVEAIRNVKGTLEREKTPLENQLANQLAEQQNQLVSDFASFAEVRMEELTSAKDSIVGEASDAIVDDIAIDVSAAGNGPKAVEAGSVEAFEIIAKATEGRNDPMQQIGKEQVQLAKEQNNILKDVERAIAGGEVLLPSAL